MFVLRDARKNDLDGLVRLAKILNTVNLPDDEDRLQEVLDRAVKSFSGAIENPWEREYLFVCEDTKKKKIVGTSMIIAQHGTKNTPHLYFEVSEDQRYSTTLDRHFNHTALRLRRDFDGPTEIGGLVLDPAYRGSEEKIGKQLSYVRFLFIAMNRKWFRRRLLAELLPPLLEDGKSLLWEHLGRHFTGLDYTEADHISRHNKEFIVNLFPQGEIYATTLPKEVQDVIGQVGENTKGVQKMLERIGFEYSHRIDPFDGGPHFECETNAVSIINDTKRANVEIRDDLIGDRMLVGRFDADSKDRFRSITCEVQQLSRKLLLSTKDAEALDVSNGDVVYALPFESVEE